MRQLYQLSNSAMLIKKTKERIVSMITCCALFLVAARSVYKEYLCGKINSFLVIMYTTEVINCSLYANMFCEKNEYCYYNNN